MNKKIFILRADKFRDNVKRGLFEALKTLPIDKNWQIAITPYKEDKTANQRGFFHLLCGKFAQETGHTPNEIKMFCKEECFGTSEVTIAGKTKSVVKSSEDAKRDEYRELIETCYRLAAEAGVVLPPPLYVG